jgi:uncharacterized protein YbjQ (UPF0145 family)
MTVDGWDGRGLPPVAEARIARASQDGVKTSLLSSAGAAGLVAAGFDVVGEVLGTTVMQIGWTGYGGCGWYGGGINGGVFGPTTMVSSSSRWSGYAPYVNAIRHGRDMAMSRMTQEAAALGADGVVGIQFTDQRMEGQKREFMALGTAVRSRGGVRPARPFTTDLNGQDVAKLISAGWVPAGLTYGISVVIRHDDWRTQQQVSAFTGNTEVSGYTELLTHARDEARHEFAQQAARIGGDSALASGIWSHVWPLEVSEGHRDHVAECLIVGNVIARFHTGDRPLTNSLTILPLRSAR